ncbi:hypothetical protein [Paenibacillus xylaniclasticus]|uniref:hypothetical protein n=1 Tax=Paenibacillus xylaniclasticus TaxID=588083 RepID=UPI0013E0E3FC|nr:MULTISPECIES: hypothetical protein [Paenibacillus]GFN32438.1 hypothetical protein PCURB6_26980 [Paenibacillus curdlanolyticus]
MILLNDNVVNFETFPNGETRIDGDEISRISYHHNQITLKYENDGDLIKLMLLKNTFGS